MPWNVRRKICKSASHLEHASGRPTHRRPADFVIHYAYLLEHAGLDTAKRFRQAVEQTYTGLAKMPGMGSPAKLRKGKHAGVRIWPVRGFENYLIAYRPHRKGIAVERVVHARQDYQRALK